MNWQDELKDVGEYVGGILRDNRRKSGMNRTDSETVKAFLPQTADVYRLVYGRRDITQKRQSVIVGTCNNPVFSDLQDEVNQMWTEAVVRWRIGEPLYPDDLMDAKALAKQEEHMRGRETDIGMICACIGQFASVLPVQLEDSMIGVDGDGTQNKKRFHKRTIVGQPHERRTGFLRNI